MSRRTCKRLSGTCEYFVNIVQCFLTFAGNCDMFFDRINEGDISMIRCPENAVINVTSASFYKLKPDKILWSSSATSDYYLALNKYCDNNAIDTVSQDCDGKQSCSIHATEYRLGDPCVGVRKNYVNISYTCYKSRNGNNYFFLKHPRVTSFSLLFIKLVSII